MKVFCPALLSEKYLPTKFANKGVQGGQNVSIPISWSDIPAGTKSFALSFLNRNPAPTNAVHWIVINLPSSTRGVSENASRLRNKLPGGSMELRNLTGGVGYSGPQPHKGTGSHEYAITVYALNCQMLELGPYSSYDDFVDAIKGKVIASASTIAALPQ